MDHLWTNSKNKKEVESLSKISETAFKDLESSQNTPMKEVLEPEWQEHISSRFPKTNDDTLQEDMAKKFLIDSEYMDNINANYNKGTETYQTMMDKLWEIYNKQIELGKYLELYKDIQKRMNKLSDEINILNKKREIQEKFPMAKSGISNQEGLLLIKQQADKMKKELEDMQSVIPSKESILKIMEEYNKISLNYNIVRDSIEPEHPEQN